MGRQRKQLAFDHRLRQISDSAIRKAMAEHGSDIKRMRACLLSAGYVATDEDIVAAWFYGASPYATSWRALPSNNLELLARLLGDPGPPWVPGTVIHGHWKATLVDPDDGNGNGNGDRLLELADDVLAAMGWTIGDTLDVKRLPGGGLRMRKSGTT